MAKQISHEDTIRFLLSCLTHTPGKTDTDAVAKELGLPQGKTAYFRLWTMKKKYLQSTGAVNGSDSADAAEGVVALNKDGSPRKKAGRPRKVKPEDDEAVGNGVKSGKGKRKAKGSKRKDADDEEYDGARSQQKRVKTQNTGAGDTDTDGEFAM